MLSRKDRRRAFWRGFGSVFCLFPKEHEPIRFPSVDPPEPPALDKEEMAFAIVSMVREKRRAGFEPSTRDYVDTVLVELKRQGVGR